MIRHPLSAVLFLAASAGCLIASGCASEPVSDKVAAEMICIHHHANSPEEQARCRVDPGLRNDPPPDMLPQELP